VTHFTSDVYDHFSARGLAGAGFAGFYCPNSPQVASVTKLTRGQLISTKQFLARESGLIAGSGGECGQFERGQVGFIGFKFNNGNGDQYGWVRIKLNQCFLSFQLIDYAYGDPGEPVRAGQTSNNDMVPVESDDVVPQEGSLGALALGAAGLLAWRKRRSQAAC
jgi:MYXO-CTERM domain-containing protein